MQEHKHYYFLENLHKLSFYIKEHLPNGKVKIKIYFNFSLGPQNGKISFWVKTQIILIFSSSLALQINKKMFPLAVSQVWKKTLKIKT